MKVYHIASYSVSTFQPQFRHLLTSCPEKAMKEYMADGVKKVIEQATEQIREDIKGVGITVEAVQSDVQHISEAVDSHSRQLERLEPMQKTLAQVKSEVDVVKSTLEQVNLVDLKQEVSDLKKRVEDLETRVVK